MTETLEPPLGVRQLGFDEAIDKTVNWTLSLYVSRERLATATGATITPLHALKVQSEDEGSLELRDAIEPLFNDIADRERLGRVEDILLATPGPRQGETISISMPDQIEWQTEGKRFRTCPSGLGQKRLLVLRRFWQLHVNGALSYHLSFQMNYDHTPGDFYFLSIIQKALAPKEFRIEGLSASDVLKRPVCPTETAQTGCLPLDEVRVCDEHVVDTPLWQFVRRRFEDDAHSLLPRLSAAAGKALADPSGLSATTLIEDAPFIEVQGLRMPLCRFMFFFKDSALFRRLMPSVDPVTGARPSRAQMCQSPCYAPYAKKMEELVARGGHSSPPLVEMDKDYWDWVMQRPDYAGYLSSLTEEEQRALTATKRQQLPAFDGDWTRPDCLQFLFLSGFVQNIIDFMNQDTSEIQDSLDPIYPVTEQQEDESFFVRFANPRALVTFVEGSRSLEIGQDYIGTCPYAFLIHVSALHNEFLARSYEALTFNLIAEVEALNRKGRLKTAASAFYRFRTGPFSDFQRHRYQNHFRYDTERDVFAALERLRGTSRREQLLETLVLNMESQTRDLEARTAKQDEQRLSLLLGALGVFGLFQLAFIWAESLRRYQQYGGEAGDRGVILGFIESWGLADLIEIWSLRLSMVFTAAIVAYGVYYLVRRLLR